MEEKPCRAQSRTLTHMPSRLAQYNQDDDDDEWRTVRIMPALLRIFTRVNLLVFIGEEQGMEFVEIISQHDMKPKLKCTLQPTASKFTTIS